MNHVLCALEGTQTGRGSQVATGTPGDAGGTQRSLKTQNSKLITYNTLRLKTNLLHCLTEEVSDHSMSGGSAMRIVRRGILGAAGVLLAMGGAGLVASHAFATPSHGTSNLKIVNASGGKYAFSPKAITVSKGTTLVWKDSTTSPHTITSDKSGGFNKNINPGK